MITTANTLLYYTSYLRPISSRYSSGYTPPPLATLASSRYSVYRVADRTALAAYSTGPQAEVLHGLQ